ncbi:response regulator transcription factor [Clostridium sp.]|uniref:response regulator transcription factor n=1 Tax=Clostridium sp. TaxID=1506 RepID=UPI003F404FAE
MKILIIEDEEYLASALKRGFEKLNYVVDIASDGEEGLELTFINKYDLIILDLNLPSMDGLDILSNIRKKDEESKIIILSARSKFDERIKGLDMGANDYLVKPFDFGELAARVRSLLRRNFIQKSSELSCENIKVDIPGRIALTRDGKKIDLSPKEFSILEYLMTNRGRVVSAEELIEHVWHSECDMFSNVIKVHISALRKKLSAYCTEDIISNIRGVGYIIKGED